MKTSFANPSKKAPQSRGMSAMLRRLAARRVAQAMTAGALIVLGGHAASAQTTFSFGKSVLTSNDPTLTSATALGALTYAGGATVEFLGPATIGAGGTGAPASGGGLEVAATGDFTTTTPGIGTTAAPFGILQSPTTTLQTDYATVGLYDYAATTGTTTFNITGGSQIANFYSSTVGASVNFDDVTAGTLSSGGANIQLESIRFNTNQAETLNTPTNSGGLIGTFGILVTPNVGANNTTIGLGNSTGFLDPSRGTSGNYGITIWQNNLLGLLNLSAPITNGKTGANVVIYSGISTTVATGGSTYTGATYVNDGDLEINTNAALGTPATGATVFLKGGTLVANGTFALDNNGANLRTITIGNSGGTIAGTATASGTGGPNGDGSGGVLAATTGNILTVNGPITTAANEGTTTPSLYIGTGILPGTGAGTANLTGVSGNGTVTLTAAEAYTGPTVVNDGTLNLTGSLTGSSLVTVNGPQTINFFNGGQTPGNTVAQTGGTLTGTGSITNGLVVNGGGVVSLAGATSTQSLTAGSAGGITLGGPNSYAPGNYAQLNFASGGASGFETLNTAGALTLNPSGVFVSITGVATANTYNLVTFGSETGTGAFSLSPTTAGQKTLSVGRTTYTLGSTAIAETVTVAAPAAPSLAYFDGVVSGNFNDLSNLNSTNFSTDAAGATTTLNVPASTTDVILTASDAAAATQAPNETLGNANSTINSLTVNGSATNTITDTASLTINAGATTNNTLGNGISIGAAANAFTINAPLVVGGAGAAQSYTNNSANLFTIGKTLTGTGASGNTQTLTLADTGAGGTTVSGAIADSGAGGKLAVNINNTGAGVTTFGAANSYSGGTTLTAGTLALSNGATLGSGATTLAGGSLVSNYANGNRLTLNNVSGTGTITGSQMTSINTLLSGGTLTLISTAGTAGAPAANPLGIAFLNTGSAFVGTLNLLGPIGATALNDFVTYFNGVPAFNGSFAQATINLTNFARLVGSTNSGGGTVTIGALTGDATSVLAGGSSGAVTYNIGGLGTAATPVNGTFSGIVGGLTTNVILTKTGVGTLTLAGTGDNYTGLTTVSQGTLTGTTAGAFGTGSVTVTPTVSTGATTDNATLNTNGSIAAGATVTVNNEAEAAGGTGFGVGTVNFNGTTPTIALLTGSGNAVLNSGTTTNLTLGATGTATTTFTGVISQGTGTTGSLTKTGANTEALSGANTYGGTTTVSQGTLLISNTAGSSATGTSTVNVNPTTGVAGTPVTAILSGTGIATGPVAVASGTAGTPDPNNIAVLAPGVNAAGTSHGGTVGTLSVGATGGLSLTAATLDYDLSAAGDTAVNTPNPANDTIVTGGTLTIRNSGAFNVNINELTADTLDTTNAYTLVSGFTNQTGFNAANITTTFTGNTSSVYTPVYNLAPNGATNNLTVTFAAAPEPAQTATMGLIVLGMGALFLRARKRRQGEKSAS